MDYAPYLILLIVLTSLMRSSSGGGKIDGSAKRFLFWMLGTAGFVLFLGIFLVNKHFNEPGNCITHPGSIPWKKEDRKFGVKVVLPCSACEYYQIAYTTNGFLTTKTLDSFEEYHREPTTGLWVFEDAVRIAKTLKSEQDCILFNEHVKQKYDSLSTRKPKQLQI